MVNKFDVINPDEIPHTSRKVDRIFLHCSANSSRDNDDPKVIDRWHKDRGWAGIGYHLFIQMNGKLRMGRSLDKIPAAQSKNNTGTIAVCLHGGGGDPPKDDFTAAQFHTLKEVVDVLHERYPDATFHGHKEVAAKACPVFDYREVLDLGPNGEYTHKPEPPPPPPPDMGDMVWWQEPAPIEIPRWAYALIGVAAIVILLLLIT